MSLEWDADALTLRARQSLLLAFDALSDALTGGAPVGATYDALGSEDARLAMVEGFAQLAAFLIDFAADPYLGRDWGDLNLPERKRFLASMREGILAERVTLG